jgi:predicted enzyme related to lactoylglutathione lyase
VIPPAAQGAPPVLNRRETAMVERNTPWPPGTPSWVDLQTTDPDSSRAFYSELFGWEFNVGGPETGFYGMATLRGKEVAGIGGMQGGMQRPVWTTYLETPDVDATVQKIRDAGGTILAEPMDVMEFGRLAVFADPTGAATGLWQSGTHTGVQLANEPGGLIWNEVMTRDYERAKQFYADVFGYTYSEIGDGGFQYSTMAVDGNTVGGIGLLPPDFPADIPAHWRVYFAVDNCDDAVDLLVKQGGSVIKPPEDMPYGRWADVADPQGAMFSVMSPYADQDAQ